MFLLQVKMEYFAPGTPVGFTSDDGTVKLYSDQVNFPL